MIINPSNARNWSRLGSRGVFGLTMLEMMEKHDDIIVLSADLVITSGLAKVKATYPDRVINTGIAEQNLGGVAAGLAKEGYNVFCTTFATFATMRAFEMARLNMGYMKFPIKLVGLAGGFSMGMFGNTHYAVEDIALMRTIPNICVLSPADCSETTKAIEAAYNHPGPVYIRLSGISGNPVVYKDNYDFQIGKSITLKEGVDVAIIATGTMVHESLEAAKILEENGIFASVIDMHTIKPLDTAAILPLIDKKLIVTVEEHSIIGGLGGAVAEYKSTLIYFPHQLFIGIEDEFKKAGNFKYMLEQNGLTATFIAEKINKALCK